MIFSAIYAVFILAIYYAQVTTVAQGALDTQSQLYGDHSGDSLEA